MADIGPRICCLDLDTFFVSVERLLDPALEGKPVIVGGRPGSRGVVTAASYEVRKLGVRSGMSLTEAQRRAPNATYLPTRHGAYEEYAQAVRSIARDFSPLVQVASIDEMYIDFTGTERLHAQYFEATSTGGADDEDATIEAAVRGLTARIQSDVGLPASAGIATSKSMAKVACRLAKPAGVVMIAAGDEAQTLAPLAPREFPGIGAVAAAKLDALGLRTLGAIAEADDARLSPVFGSRVSGLKACLRGEYRGGLGIDRPAFREHDPRVGEPGPARPGPRTGLGSISNERTFHRDLQKREQIDAVLRSLSERVAWRARKRGIKAGSVTLKLRFSNFETLNRSRKLSLTADESDIYRSVRNLTDRALRQTDASAGGPSPGREVTRGIRLLGVGLADLAQDEQLPLFAAQEPLHGVVDAIKQRFGYEAVESALAKSHRGGPKPSSPSRARRSPAGPLPDKGR